MNQAVKIFVLYMGGISVAEQQLKRSGQDPFNPRLRVKNEKNRLKRIQKGPT